MKRCVMIYFTKLIFFLTTDLKFFTLCDIIQQMKKVLPYTYICHNDVATSWTSRVFWRQLTVNSKCWLVGQIRKMVLKISIILVSSSNVTNLHQHFVTSRHYVHEGKLNNIWCIDHWLISQYCSSMTTLTWCSVWETSNEASPKMP